MKLKREISRSMQEEDKKRRKAESRREDSRVICHEELQLADARAALAYDLRLP